MRKSLFVLKNLLFLAGCAFLFAKIGQTLVLSELSATQPAAFRKAEAQKKVPARPVPPLRAYAAISSENVFNSASAPEQERDTAEQEEAEEPMEETELEVLLLGTAVGPPDDTFAVIQDKTSREQALYRVGDTVQEEARIVDVSRCRVVLNRDGSREILECIEPDERTPRRARRAVRRTAGPSKGKGIRRIERNRYRIDRERVQSALANVNRLMTQARVVPSLRGGENQGWKIFAIRPNSIFREIGLRNGDVVQSVNGRALRTPTKAFQAFRELRDARNLEVEILRRNRQVTLNYEIR